MASDERQYVVFRLSIEDFGVEINKVKEIITYRETTQIPGSGEFMEGIINLRGQVIPIFNLRRKFGFPAVQHSRSTRIVVVETYDDTVGMVVDGVSEVLVIPGNAIEEPSSLIASGIDSDYLSGVAKLEDKLVMILELDKAINIGVAKAV